MTTRLSRPGLDWSLLLRERTPHGALAQLREWAGGDLELVLELDEAGHREIARTTPIGPPTSRRGERGVRIAGTPSWRLWGRGPSGTLPASRLEEIAAPLEVWRAARSELSRAERRLGSRTEELEALQAFGRNCSEATTVAGLVRETGTLLHERARVDAVLVGLVGAADPLIWVLLSRPLDPKDLVALTERMAQVPPPGARARLEVHQLEGYDASRGARRAMADELQVAPLVRRGQVVGVLALLAAAGPSEAELRLFWAVANQLALHLERVLATREGERGRFRAVLDSMPQAVLVTDARLRTVLANRVAAAWMDRLGPGAVDGLATLGDLDVRALVEPVLAGSLPSTKGEAHLPDGGILGVTVAPVLPQPVTGEAGLVLVLTDITDERRRQEQLAHSEKLSSLGQMVSGIAHELNNPLAAVLGYAQLLSRAGLDPQVTARLELIHQEARRCQRIVQNLLSFARRHEPEQRPLSLNEVVGSVLSLMEYQLRSEGIRVETELDVHVPSVLGDRHQLQQVLVNLISNAQQAIRESGTGGTIRVRTLCRPDQGARLEVADDGPGIPEDVRPFIFDPFFTTKRAGLGTGLGLSIVYGSVSAHGGTVDVTSRPGGGATFVVELPPAVTKPARRGRRLRPTAEGRRGRILVVDDEESLVQLVCEALVADGHTTVSARSGVEALTRLAVDDFDVIVSDVKMPDMGAQSLQREMERLRPGISRRLVLTTGDTFGPETVAFAARQRLEVLHKPFDLDDLRRAVRARLSSPHG